MARGEGSGWHHESRRHSEAAKKSRPTHAPQPWKDKRETYNNLAKKYGCKPDKESILTALQIKYQFTKGRERKKVQEDIHRFNYANSQGSYSED